MIMDLNLLIRSSYLWVPLLPSALGVISKACVRNGLRLLRPPLGFSVFCGVLLVLRSVSLLIVMAIIKAVHLVLKLCRFRDV